MYKDDPDIICNELRFDSLSSSEVQTKEVIAYELEKLDKEYKTFGYSSQPVRFAKLSIFRVQRFLEKTMYQLLLLGTLVDHPMRMKRLIVIEL